MRCILKHILPHGSAGFELLGSKDGERVWHCKACGLITCSIAGREQYLDLYKKDARYFELVGAGYASFEDRFQHDYGVSEVRLRNILRWTTAAKTLLDVGTGNGAFLQRCVEAGFKCHGVDLNAWMLKKASVLVPKAVLRCGEITELEFDTTFDVITFIDVFEHVLDPLNYVKRIRELLSKGGLVVIETPDTESDGWKKQGVQWTHCKPHEHPFLYNEKHISTIFATVGLTLVSMVFTIPGRCTYYLRG